MQGRSFEYRPYTITMSAPTERFSRLEIRHITIAYLVLTLDFWLIVSGVSLLGSGNMYGYYFGVLWALPVAATVAATAFVTHELAHKFSAQKMGIWAEFRMSSQGLVISVILSLLGFLLAAPGATMVGGWHTKKEAGETSIAGPLTNLGWATLFLGSSFLTAHLSLHNWMPYTNWSVWTAFLVVVAMVNLVLAAFNLLPIGPLDGKKVLNWNKGLWAVCFFGTLAVLISLYVMFQIPI
jgi:Zn-dependent protease